MTWTQRVQASGVVTLVLAGMLVTAAAALGVAPAKPPQIVEAFIALLVIAKAVATAGGALAFVTGRG